MAYESGRILIRIDPYAAGIMFIHGVNLFIVNPEIVEIRHVLILRRELISIIVLVY